MIYYGSGQTPQYGKIKDPYLDEGDFVFELKQPDEIAAEKAKDEQPDKVSPMEKVKTGRLAPETECDRLAGHPDDPLRLSSVKGVTSNQISLPDTKIACKKAVETYPDEPRLMFQYGRALHKSKNYDDAVQWYKKAADLGNAQALYNIAWFYDRGRGVKKDAQEAARWMESALRAGSEFARKQMRENASSWSQSFRIALQKRLKKSSVYHRNFYGIFGPKTHKAIDAIFKKL